MTQQTEKTWQYGQAAATLLVAYMFVLQGLAAGFVIGARSVGGPSELICLNAGAKPSGDKPAGPSRGSHAMDACCVQHCSGLGDGVLAEFVQPAPPVAAYASVLAPLFDIGHRPRAGALPVGARAPPSSAA